MMTISEVNRTIETLRNSGISVKDISDGHHTFKELYKQRVIFLSIICQNYKELSWKSKKHFDEENDPMFNGDFIIGINTPKGMATYHIKMEYWDLFPIKELPSAPKYDNYSVDEVIDRIASLSKIHKS